MKNVVLNGKLIRLRPLRLSDASDLITGLNNPDVLCWLSSVSYPVSLKQEKEFVRKTIKEWKGGESLTLGVEHKLLKRIIGCCDLHMNKKDNRAFYGLWIAKEFWGIGLGKEMARLVFDFGFRKVGLNRIEYSLFAPNVRSKALIEGLGGKFEGIRRQFRKKKDDRYYDDLVYSILRKEWLGKRSNAKHL